MATPSKPRIFVAIKPSLYRTLFDEQAAHALRSAGEVVFEESEGAQNSAALAQKLAGFDAVITGWGTPRFTDEVLTHASRLKLVAHSAGTVKHMLPESVFAKDIAVTHAAAAIAPGVADMSLLLTMTMLRRTFEGHELIRQGEWARFETGHEISGQRIGVIAASYTGRFFIKLLKAVEAEVWVFDPYLTEARAAELGVKKAGLEELLAGCRVVSLQAPVTNETKRMIGARELACMPDGHALVNTARSALVDMDALLRELQTGRISAALDVFDEEPLPADSPFRKLRNVHLTPHIAGATAQSRLRQGKLCADEVARFFRGEALKYRITAEMLATMA